MKANELMIGDWVLDKKTNRPYKIIGTNDLLFHDDYSHIPLTAEILEKNGFNCEEIIQPHWISEDGRILLRNDESLIDSNNKWSVHVYNEDMQTIGYFELTYVHQLQHALRLCNIDKKIEL